MRFRRADGTLYDGVASYGRRPTVDRTARRCSKPSSSISGDLYGQTCSVSFFGYLRAELKFDGLDPLVAQMKHDDEEASALLSGVSRSARSTAIAFARMQRTEG